MFLLSHFIVSFLELFILLFNLLPEFIGFLSGMQLFLLFALDFRKYVPQLPVLLVLLLESLGQFLVFQLELLDHGVLLGELGFDVLQLFRVCEGVFTLDYIFELMSKSGAFVSVHLHFHFQFCHLS